MTVTTAERFRTAAVKGDLAALNGLLTDDVRCYSPVKFTPFEGREAVAALLAVVMRTFENFRYVGEYAGESETSTDGSTAESAVLLFRTTVRGKEVHGIDLLHFAEDGRVKELTVMVRPSSAVRAVAEAVLAGLIEDGVVPAPAEGAE